MGHCNKSRMPRPPPELNWGCILARAAQLCSASNANLKTARAIHFVDLVVLEENIGEGKRRGGGLNRQSEDRQGDEGGSGGEEHHPPAASLKGSRAASASLAPVSANGQRLLFLWRIFAAQQ